MAETTETTDWPRLYDRLLMMCKKVGIVAADDVETLLYGRGERGGLEEWLREKLPRGGVRAWPMLEVRVQPVVVYATWSVDDGSGRVPISDTKGYLDEVTARAEAAIQAVQWMLTKRVEERET